MSGSIRDTRVDCSSLWERATLSGRGVESNSWLIGLGYDVTDPWESASSATDFPIPQVCWYFFF